MSISDVANDSSILSTEEGKNLCQNLLHICWCWLRPSDSSSSHESSTAPQCSNQWEAESSVQRLSAHIANATIFAYIDTDRQPSTANGITSASLVPPSRCNQFFNHSANLMSTPPPNRALARQSLKGVWLIPRNREGAKPLELYVSFPRKQWRESQAATGSSSTVGSENSNEKNQVMYEQPNLKVTKTFSWRHLNHTVSVSGERWLLLDDVSGFVAPGKLIALMGESGAG